MNLKHGAVLLSTGLLVFASACGSADSTPKSSPSKAASASSTESASTPTKAQITGAMLTEADMPAGYKLSNDSDDSDVKGSGDGAGCADLVKVVFGNVLPGAQFEVDREFDASDGQSISESVAQFASADEAAAMVKRIGEDSAACKEVTASSGGQSFTFKISVAPKPDAGTEGNATTLTGTGQLKGLVSTGTTILQGSTVIGLNAPTPTEANDFTTLALSRLTPVIGAAS